jgi:hypothetical protein
MRLLLPLIPLTIALLLAVTGQAQITHAVHQGDQATERLGSALAGAGDVDGDLVPDRIAGSWAFGAGAGRARVFSGADGSTLFVFTGQNPAEYLGCGVDAAGDVNGDGHGDLLVAAYGDGTNGVESGAVWILSGADGTVLRALHGNAALERFGVSVARAGDVNGDLVPDVIVGASGATPSGFDSGRAAVFSGADGSLLDDFPGQAANENAGHAVAGVGDVNGDGRADVAIGAWGARPQGINSGTVRVHSGLDGSLLHVFDGGGVGDYQGWAVAAAGDVDGDGFDDVAVGAPMCDAAGLDAGRVTVYSGFDGATRWIVDGPAPEGRFGWALAAAGDTNGDGVPDLVAGAPLLDLGGGRLGGAAVISGSDGSLLEVLPGEALFDSFGWAVGGPGDVNGDGFDDVLVGAPASNGPAGVDLGSAYLLSVCGARRYSGTAGGTNTIELGWHADPLGIADGLLGIAGAAPFAIGILGVSGLSVDLLAGGLNLLVGLGPGEVQFFPFVHDADGAFWYPLELNIPVLDGTHVFLQSVAFGAPAIEASNGLEILFRR